MNNRVLRKAVILVVGLFGWLVSGVEAATISERKKDIAKEEKIFLRQASGDPSEGVSSLAGLEDYLRVALARNLGLRSAFYSWKSSFEKIAQSFSLPDPEFTFTDYLREVETRVGPQERSFSLRQKFPFPDKLWIRRSRSFKLSEAAYYEFRQKELDLIYQVTDAYFEYAYLSKAIILTQENMKFLRNLESAAQVRYSSGLTKNQDLLKVQVELGKLENELLSLEDMRSFLAARLNALLDLPESVLLPWPEETLEDADLESRFSQAQALVNQLEEGNFQLLRLSKVVEQNQDALKLSKREYFPDLTLGVTKIETGPALNPVTIDSGKDPLMVSLSVNVPIWFDRLRAGVADARASLMASENALKDKENELSSRLALVHYKLRDALRQTKLYKDALIPKAVQTLNSTQSGYEAGIVDFLSLIDAQRMLLNFQLAYYRNSANFQQRLAEVKALLGELAADTDSAKE